MKKIIALLLAMALCCGMLFGCAPATEAGPTLDEAVAYLTSSYRTDEGKTTSADYKLMAQIPIDNVKFEVTWTVDLDTIKITLGDDGLYHVDLPAKNDSEIQYILTATVKDANGETTSKEFTRILGVYDDSAAVTEPVEGEAYKMFFVQGNLGKTLYCIGEAQQDKFIKTDADPKKGNDFFVEKVDGGYKFYTDINGAKMYLHASTTTSDTGKISKYLSYAAESDVVYYYKTEVKTWMVKIDNVEYGVGTYNDFNTMSLSEGTYFTAESAGTTQFCMALMAKDAAEALTPDEGPKDPTELSNITDLLTKANALEDKTQTAEKYLVKGVIDRIESAEYGNMYIKDEAGNELYIYGVYSKDGSTRFDAMDPQPKVGDNITLMGVLSKYNDVPQMKNAWTIELNGVAGGDSSGDNTDGPSTPSTDPAADSVLTVEQAIALGAAKEHDTYTEGKYYVTGEITEVYNTQYGNMKIKDSKGNILTIYGTYSADGKTRYDELSTKPVTGDTVKIYGIVGQYNGTAQIKNGWIVEHTPGKGGSSGDNTDTPSTPNLSTPAEIVKAAFALADGESLAEQVTLTGVVTKVGDINATYGDRNVNFTVEGKDIYCYALKGDVAKILVGDTITVKGTIKNYKGTIEFDKAQLVSGGTGTGENAGGSSSTGGETVTVDTPNAVTCKLSVDVEGTKQYIVALDGGWVTATTTAASAGTITVYFSADEDYAKIKVGSTYIAPKGGNTNGIKEGEYLWAVVKNADGTYSFQGQGSDTVTLAFNSASDWMKFRAYKNATVTGENAATYPTKFNLEQ